MSPYRFAGNTPIQAVDLDGLEPLHLSETEYQKYATATFQYEQHYDGQTHKIDMMQVDGDWIFSRPEGDKEQWYYLNKKQEWEKFSNDRNYADGVRETVDNIVIAGGTAALAGAVIGASAGFALEAWGLGATAAWAKNITKVPTAKSATSLGKTSPIVNAAKAEVSSISKTTKELGKLSFEELQTVTKTYSAEMNVFFKSGGKETVSREALMTYRELATRIVKGSGGAPATKMTEKALKVQSERIELINRALEINK